MYRERANDGMEPAINTRDDRVVAHLASQLDSRIVALSQRGAAGNTRLHAAMGHTMVAPAKRARGLLAMLVARSWGRPPELALNAAVALEMVHAASLLLDDLPVMDDTPVRRGKPACHVVFGEGTTILAAVAMLSGAFGAVAADERLSAPQRVALVDVLSRAVGPEGMTGGQEEDINPPGGDATLVSIERTYAAKTGVLFEASALAGSIAAGIEGPRRALMGDFGMRLGLGFQILDDLADAGAGAEGAAVAQDRSAPGLVELIGASAARARADAHIAVARECLEASGADVTALVGYVDDLVALMLAKTRRH